MGAVTGVGAYLCWGAYTVGWDADRTWTIAMGMDNVDATSADPEEGIASSFFFLHARSKIEMVQLDRVLINSPNNIQENFPFEID